MDVSGDVAILGGGPAGLSAGYYARKYHVPFTIFEAQDRIGGNSCTFRHGDFYFDSGPHLLQTKDVELTAEINQLLEGHLHKLTLPVQTYCGGRLLDFPFSPLNLLNTLGPRLSAKIVSEIIIQRLAGAQHNASFESFAIQSYGKTLAELVLLNYSSKLWGRPCSELSAKIGGKGLKGLDLRTLLIEVMRGRRARIEHLGGTIYYPRKGFGVISEKLADHCGRNKIRTNSTVTSLMCKDSRVKAIEVNGVETIQTEAVLSTLPLDTLIRLIRPGPPDEILGIANSLRYRSLILIVLFVDKPSVTESASIHFPDPTIPFTRIHEPKNRSASMSPEKQSSLVVEIPCQQGDNVWNLENAKLIQLAQSGLVDLGMVRNQEVFDSLVVRLDHAYPILDLGYEGNLQRILDYLKSYENLRLTGRTGAFAYLSLHHIMRTSRKVIRQFAVGYDSEPKLQTASLSGGV